MKSLVLAAWFLFPLGGDRERGLALYQEGRFAEAVVAFRAALESEGDSAELQWNLAMALWRAGELPAAEQAVERYAAQAGDRRADLHSGLLGAIRYGEAKAMEGASDEIARAGPHTAPPPAPVQGGPPPAAAPADPLPLLEQALEKARQARDYFVRGGTGMSAAPEVARNAERALRYVGELEKKIEELKKQREQQKKDDEQKQDQQNKDDKKDDQKKDDQQKQDQPKDEQKKQDEQKSDDQKQQDQKQQDQKQQDQPKPDEKSDPSKDQPGEPKPEPKPEQQKPEEPKPEQQQGKDETEPKPGEQQQEKPQPKPEPPKDKPEEKPAEAKPRTDAPGEQQEGKELTPEQKARLLEQLEKLDQQLKAIRTRAQQGRRPVERDW